MESFQEKEITLYFSKYKVFAQCVLRKLNSMNVFACLYLQIIWITFCQTEILSHNNRLLPRLELLDIM